ncbi:Sphingomyelin phosphodiesterase [Penicillium bovifimosum]|uniref:Sphingomyelin phosphodiesterase n=1 Tax=Penicillium bovifimosum TaxID=126998 RepID=A0A9W9LA11_9EURO|nr:Sphingomyelin phosphodiesterase [Penicillium bovifimosum]KAJ5144017.1 Sphingomyelin phosphodiesterase [Penicillium bovifimosum]
MRINTLLLACGLSASFQGVHAEANTEKTIATIWDDFKNAVDCGGCQALLGTLKVASGLGEKFWLDVFTGLCTITGIEDPDVCSGIIAAEGPSLYAALKTMHLNSGTSKTLCASLLGLCPYPEVRPYDLTFPSPKPKTVRPPPSGKSPIKVVHFSDTHVDLLYETGSNYECNKPICCRAYEDKDAPGVTEHPCGPYGNPQCDPPARLQESMHAAIAQINPEFSIYTGDVISHDVWMVDQAKVLEGLNATYSAIDRDIGTVYASIGNHDTAPLNLFPPTNASKDDDPEWAYQALAEDWFSLTGVPSVQDADQYGSYSAVHPGSNLRIISYNSVFYYIYNFLMYGEPIEQDPRGQFEWLIQELQAAEDAGQRAWLIAHIPSGVPDHFRDHSQYFDQIVQRYEATIAGLFYGHTHTDEFQIAYSDYNNRDWNTATAMGYIAPAMTPTEGSASFRVYDIDPVTFGVLDYTQYIANISDPSYQVKPEWVPYYSAKADYGSKISPPVTDPKAEITPAFWHNVTVAMERDPSVFQDFWSRRVRGHEVEECDGDCAKSEICQLRAANAQYNCVKPKAFNFKRDGEESVLVEKDPHVNCDHAGMATIIAKMMHRAKIDRKKEIEAR